MRCTAKTATVAAGKVSGGRLDEHVADAAKQTLHLLRSLGQRPQQQQARRRRRDAVSVVSDGAMLPGHGPRSLPNDPAYDSPVQAASHVGS